MEKRNAFGTFGGVFTPCLLTILGVIMFMRANFVVAQAGIGSALLILLAAKSITLLTTLSTSAISTNMEVRGGGAYFLISRVLGLHYGGSIGLLLYLAQAVSAPFYMLGFTEALVYTFPVLAPYHGWIVFGGTAILFTVAYIGAGWAIRVQYGIMAILLLSVVCFLGGAARLFSWDVLEANWSSGYTGIAGGGGNYTFWGIFAIYFPAVTGIMAGLNMSGDLKRPARSIPRGTLAAIGVGAGVYLLQMVLCGGAFDRETLREEPFLVLQNHALFSAGWLVTAGMFAATLSSALGSLMGAPRVLQAVARDDVLPVLSIFARGSRRGDEPRRALLATGVISALVLAWAMGVGGETALNMVAELITEFFLVTYGMLNLAALIEGVGGNPSFRPQFRWFHWITALLGSVGCLGVVLVIDLKVALIALALVLLLIVYIRGRNLQMASGDAWRGFLYRNIRNDLLRLSEMRETAKNWRPTCLVFSGNPEERGLLVAFGRWLEAGRGLVFLAQVLVGRVAEYAPRRAAVQERLGEFCREEGLSAFPVVVIDESLKGGMIATMQALCVGPIRPNLMLLGWTRETEERDHVAAVVHMAQLLGVSTCFLAGRNELPGEGPKRIDVWWRGLKNGGLMLLLAHLLRQNWAWRNSEVRLVRSVPNEAAREGTLADLEALLQKARVSARAEVVVSEASFAQVLRQESGDAALVVLGFEPPELDGKETEDWWMRYDILLKDSPPVLLVCSAGGENVMA